MKLITRINNRLHEPSTWIALGLFISGVLAYKGVGVPAYELGSLDNPEVQAQGQFLVLLPSILGAVIGAFMKDPNNGRD